MIKTLDQIKAELNVKHLVSMNEQKIVIRGESIGTFALCGCTCFVAISQAEILLSHYDPYSINTQLAGLKKWAQNKLFDLHIFTPGEWAKNNEAKWVMQPKKNFCIDGAIVKGYSEINSLGETLFSRSVVWDGKQLLSGFH